MAALVGGEQGSRRARSRAAPHLPTLLRPVGFETYRKRRHSETQFTRTQYYSTKKDPLPVKVKMSDFARLQVSLRQYRASFQDCFSSHLTFRF